MYRITEIAAELNISQSTVRRLAERFAAALSDERDERGTRHFTAADLERLRLIQRLRARGQSDEAIRAQLAAEGGEAIIEGETVPESDARALARLEGGEALPMSPQAAALLAQALQQLSEMQQTLQATQEQQREMLGALADESGALKDENERLRRRLRMMEEEMSQLKESDWAQRLTLEERLHQLERGEEPPRPWWERLWKR